MYLRKILTDGNKEFMENMRIDIIMYESKS